MNIDFSKRMQPLFWLSATVLLSACGGSDTTIVEREPVAEEEHGHEDEHSGEGLNTKGRLLVSPYAEEEVVLFELDDGSELAHYPVTGAVSALQPSADFQYGLIVQRDANRVDALDSGLSREYHNDHWDYERVAPSFMDFTAEGVRPTHFTTGGNRSVVFFDGLGDSALPASVGVYTEQDLADNGAGLQLELDTHQHGAARWLEGHLLVSQRDPADDSTSLPDRVALYHPHDGELELEETFAETCPGLHGSAQLEHRVAFGCTDGVLVIHWDGSDFTANKVTNPDNMEGRIGSLYASETHDVMLGVASGNLYELDFGAGTMTAIDWRGGIEREPVAYAFDAEGEHFLVLDASGDLTLLEAADDWHRHGPLEVVTGDLSALAEDQALAMTVSHASHLVYVTDPLENRILEVDLESETVAEALSLEFSPHKLAWLGFEGRSAEHGHEEHEDEAAHDH